MYTGMVVAKKTGRKSPQPPAVMIRTRSPSGMISSQSKRKVNPHTLSPGTYVRVDEEIASGWKKHPALPIRG
jgi:hypothetical protein